MILIMWLTGGGGKKPVTNIGPAFPPPPPAMPTDTTQVQAFKQSIQSAEQASRQAQPISPSPLTGRVASEAQPAGLPAQPATLLQEPTIQPQPDPIKAEQQKRKYLSLFASNVALTYRKGVNAEKLSGSSTGSFGSINDPLRREAAIGSSPETPALTLRDAESLAGMVPLPWPMQLNSKPQPNATQTSSGQAGLEPANPEPKPVNPNVVSPGKFNSSTSKGYVLFEGTLIPSGLINRLNGSFPGPVNCLVTQDVYSHDRAHVLIPAGSKVLGEAQKVTAFGQERLAVFFHRLIMPDGYSVSLDQFKGLDQEGTTALRDKVNNHYARIFGASLAVGILGGIAQTGTGNVFTESAIDRARVGFGESIAGAGEHILDRFLNVLPTVTIREGMRVNVYLSNDLLLPDYHQHTMPPDL